MRELDMIPKAVRERHPELGSVFQALNEFEQGISVTALCYECGELLRVEDIEVIKTLWVTCPQGCTVYREKRA